MRLLLWSLCVVTPSHVPRRILQASCYTHFFKSYKYRKVFYKTGTLETRYLLISWLLVSHSYKTNLQRGHCFPGALLNVWRAMPPGIFIPMQEKEVMLERCLQGHVLLCSRRKWCWKDVSWNMYSHAAEGSDVRDLCRKIIRSYLRLAGGR